MTNYQSAKTILSKCNTVEDVLKKSQGFERVYKAGALTVNEFKRIDGLVVKRMIELEG